MVTIAQSDAIRILLKLMDTTDEDGLFGIKVKSDELKSLIETLKTAIERSLSQVPGESA